MLVFHGFFEIIVSSNNDFSTFLAEPIILLVGIFTVISFFIWGRALFCGWLCPFGALQELFSILSKKIGIRQIFLPNYLDKNIYDAHDALMCIGSKNYLNDKNRPKLSNNHHFKSSCLLYTSPSPRDS